MDARDNRDDLDGSPARADRRRFVRIVADTPVALGVAGSTQREIVRSWDVAERGMRIHTQRPHAVGEPIVIEVEAIMPTRVNLGFDLDALAIEGPRQSRFAELHGSVRRCAQSEDGSWIMGVEFDEEESGATSDGIHSFELWLDYLRECESNGEDW